MPKLSVMLDQDPRIDWVKLPLVEGKSLLDNLAHNGVQLSHDCGGLLACATCLVIVREGLETLSAANEDEQDILDRAAATEPGSRLRGGPVAQIKLPPLKDDAVAYIAQNPSRRDEYATSTTLLAATPSSRITCESKPCVRRRCLYRWFTRLATPRPTSAKRWW